MKVRFISSRMKVKVAGKETRLLEAVAKAADQEPHC